MSDEERDHAMRSALGNVARVGMATPVEQRTSLHVHAMRGYGLVRLQLGIAHLLGASELLNESGLHDAGDALLILALDAAKAARLVPDPGEAS